MIGYVATGASTPQLFYDLGLRNCLLSFVEIKSKKAFSFWLDPPSDDVKFFLDSGAFAVFNRGTSIDIRHYCEWIQEHEPKIHTYAALDVIGDWKKSADNTTYMREQGLNPVPTFHHLGPMSELRRLCREHEYIALGGLVPLALRSKELCGWLDACFKVIREYWPVKVHLLGMNGQRVLERYPGFSYDSSAPIMQAAFGELSSFEDSRLQIINWKDKKSRGNAITADGVGAEGSARAARIAHNIKTYLRFEKHIDDLWTKRGITWQ